MVVVVAGRRRGGNGVVERGAHGFSVISLSFPKIQSSVVPSQSCPISTTIIPDMKEPTAAPLIFLSERNSLALEVTSLFSCVLIFQARDCFFFFPPVLLLRTCQAFWERSAPLCVFGPGICPYRGVCVRGMLEMSCVLWFKASWWWAAPRWPSCCVTWWCLSSEPKTSLPDGGWDAGWQWHSSKTALWHYTVIFNLTGKGETNKLHLLLLVITFLSQRFTLSK